MFLHARYILYNTHCLQFIFSVMLYINNLLSNTVTLTLESDITEVCESDGTIMLCLLLSSTIEIDLEVDVQVTDDTTTGIYLC